MTFAEELPRSDYVKERTPRHHKTEYLLFRLTGRSPSGKTEIWAVDSARHGAELGEIAWYSHWRQYTFYPAGATVFNNGCLAEIADFLDRMNREHREG